jgi:capsular polysaccharide transport system permease protein
MPTVFKRSFATVWALISREMATNYGKSPGGYIWAILEPAAGIALMTALFSIAFRQPQLGISFALFYATGMLPFTMYKDLSGKIAKSISFSEKLMAYPAVTFIDAILARLILNTITQITIFFIVFGFIMTTVETRAHLDFQWIALSIAATLNLSVGIGIFNSVAFMKVPVWENIWAILNRPMFMISCIFFLFDSVPEPFKSMLWFNPLVHIVGLMRKGFYPSYDAAYVSLTYLFAPPLILSAFGLIMLRRYHNSVR